MPLAHAPAAPLFDRRRHRIYRTRHVEYHLRDGVCVAVRDRRSACFLSGHLALFQRLGGGLGLGGDSPRLAHDGDPRPGEALIFASETVRLVTAPLEGTERPARALVERYPALPR